MAHTYGLKRSTKFKVDNKEEYINGKTFVQRHRQERAYWAAQPKWRKFLLKTLPWWIRHGVRNEIEDIRFRANTWISRAFRGYAGVDWWEYYHENSRRAVKLLTLLKEKGHGIKEEGGYAMAQAIYWPGLYKDDPESEKAHSDARDVWHAKLDDMIFFHKVHAGMYERDGKEIDAYDLNETEKARFDKGGQFYLSYYGQLWD